MATFLMVDADDFAIECPNCGTEIEEIRIRRLYAEEHECLECMSTFQICITLEPT